MRPWQWAAAVGLGLERAGVETPRVLAYLERVRSESDTGGKLGADEVVFEPGAKGGVEQVMGGGDRLKLQSAEQWMRTVDTRMADFLSLRFALEDSQGNDR